MPEVVGIRAHNVSLLLAPIGATSYFVSGCGLVRVLADRWLTPPSGATGTQARFWHTKPAPQSVIVGLQAPLTPHWRFISRLFVVSHSETQAEVLQQTLSTQNPCTHASGWALSQG